jgi:hypothetical protein
MSRGMSRRSVLKVAGVGLGAAGAVTAAGAASYRRAPLSRGELAALPRIAEQVRPTDRAALGREEALGHMSAPVPGCRVVERVLSPGEGLEGLGLDVKAFVAEFICDPRRPNILLEGVERITYEIVEVAWRSGEGRPVHRLRTPDPEPAFGMRYAGAPRHQIVFLDDRAVYVGNPGIAGVITGIEGPLRVDVNGDAHGEHAGFYKVLITGIA